MNKKIKDYQSAQFNEACCIYPQPNPVDGLGVPIADPETGELTYLKVRDVYFYSDLKHRENLDPILIKQILQGEMLEQGYDAEKLSNDEQFLDDVIESCPSRYLYSPQDVKNYLDNLKREVKQRKDYAAHLVKKSQVQPQSLE